VSDDVDDLLRFGFDRLQPTCGLIPVALAQGGGGLIEEKLEVTDGCGRFAR
jgi:hypothetical protein